MVWNFHPNVHLYSLTYKNPFSLRTLKINRVHFGRLSIFLKRADIDNVRAGCPVEFRGDDLSRWTITILEMGQIDKIRARVISFDARTLIATTNRANDNTDNSHVLRTARKHTQEWHYDPCLRLDSTTPRGFRRRLLSLTHIVIDDSEWSLVACHSLLVSRLYDRSCLSRKKDRLQERNK